MIHKIEAGKMVAYTGDRGYQEWLKIEAEAMMKEVLKKNISKQISKALKEDGLEEN